MRNLIIALVLLLPCHVFAFVSEQEVGVIDDAFSSTNHPALVIRKLEPVNTNIWFNLYQTNPSHARELQYCILTNFCAFKAGDRDYWLRWSMTERKVMFYTICEFNPTTNDVSYLNQCADFLGRELVPIEDDMDVSGGRYGWYNWDVNRT